MLRRDIPEYNRIPDGWGVAWHDFARATAVCYPIGLNLVARVLYHLYWRLVLRRLRQVVQDGNVWVSKAEWAALNMTVRNGQLAHELLDGRCLDMDDNTAAIVAWLRLIAADIEGQGVDALPVHLRYMTNEYVDSYRRQSKLEFNIAPVSEELLR